jgi:hypothetical protein
MRATQALCCTVLAWALGQLPAHAGDGSQSEATGLGEHPAVSVARHGVRADPTANFYLHPARLAWSLQRPLSEGEHPAVLVAHRNPAGIDPNRFIVAHPAGGAPSTREPAASPIR